MAEDTNGLCETFRSLVKWLLHLSVKKKGRETLGYTFKVLEHEMFLVFCEQNVQFSCFHQKLREKNPSSDKFPFKCHRHAVQQAALLPDRVSISFKSFVGLGCFLCRRRLLLFKRKEVGKKNEIHNSGCWMKWLRLKYWWVGSIAVQPSLTLFCTLSLLLIAFAGSAKCFEPRPHPVHAQTRPAGQRVRHAALSGWVCLPGAAQTSFPAGFGRRRALLARRMCYLSAQRVLWQKDLSLLDLHVHLTSPSCFLLQSSSGGRQRRRPQQHCSHHAGVRGADGPGHLFRV